MSWGDLLRYVLLGLFCLGIVGLVLYLIRNAIRSGNAGELLKEVADRVMTIRAQAKEKKDTAVKERQAAQDDAAAAFDAEVREHETEQNKQAEELLDDPDSLSHFLVRGDHKSKPS